MSSFPKTVTINEVGPREGFQTEPAIVPTAKKMQLIEALAETGLATIEIASFVNPKMVPNMADAEAVVAQLRRRPGVKYTALWLNERGFQRALATGNLDIQGSMALSASKVFLQRNKGWTPEQDQADQHRVIEMYRAHGVSVERGSVSAAFGCNFEGDIPLSAVLATVDRLMDIAAEHGETLQCINLADTMSWATPISIKRVVGAVRERYPDVRISLHLHDTRGMAIANAYSGLEMGVDEFDSSVAGLGGCPFAGHKGAAGNVCTEDFVFLCEELGIETGVKLETLIEAARLAEEVVGHDLPGSVMKGGSLSARRTATS
jgi:hydroxymethylglutaryl-CoA lyase